MKVSHSAGWRMAHRGWSCITSSTCHSKVNSPGSLLVTEDMHPAEHDMFCWVPEACVPCGLLPVRWLVVRVNPVENRNVFCHGMEGGGARVMRPAPRSHSSMCTRRDSLILSQTHREKKWKVPSYQWQRLLLTEMICKITLAHDRNWDFFFLLFPKALLLLICNSFMHTFILSIISYCYPWNYFSVQACWYCLYMSSPSSITPWCSISCGSLFSILNVQMLNSVQMVFISDSSSLSPLSCSFMWGSVSTKAKHTCFCLSAMTYPEIVKDEDACARVIL